MKKDETTKVSEVLELVSNKTVGTLSVWAEANQRMLRELVDLSVGAAKEGVRFYAELQQGAIEAVRDGQATALKWQATYQDGPKDPMQWYQKTHVESVEGAEKFFRLVEGNAHAATRFGERLQAAAEHAGKGFQETFGASITRMKDVYSQS